MLPSVLTASLMRNLVVSCRQLLAGDSALLAWSGGKIHRARELGPVTVNGRPCVGNHIVVTPGTFQGIANPNAESDAELAVAFGIAFAQRYHSMADGEDGPEDVVELIQVRLGADPTLQTTWEAADVGNSGPLVEPGLLRYPLIDSEPRFAAPDSPDGFLSFEAIYSTRINYLTRASTI